ncbi:TPA: hypothetical protein IFA10_001303 [Escherichia coli]|nr:hypothetical protein [Escherichia coli]
MLPDELEKRLDGIEDASKKGYPVRNLYKIACEPGLWLQAYVNIRANAGALTVTGSFKPSGLFPPALQK